MNSSIISAITLANTNDCALDGSTPSVWGDIANPLLFFTDNSTLCQYTSAEICEPLNIDSYRFLSPFCSDLLPFCIFYSFLRIIVSVVNYVFIYKKRIESRLRRSQELPLNEDQNRNDKNQHIDYFRKFIKMSFLVDIASSLFSFWVFKGYQYYASKFTADVVNTSDANLTLEQSSWQLVVAALIWFSLECWKTYIQIFSVSTLTHIDNLKKESQANQEKKFYKKHTKFALWWAVILFATGLLILIANLLGHADFKIYYKYYSPFAVSFWLSYTIIFILILTDRILAYDGFKKRQEFLAGDRVRSNSADSRSSNHSNNGVHLSSYQLTPTSDSYHSLQEAIRKKFPNTSQIRIHEIAGQVVTVYNTKMREHYYNLKGKAKGGMEKPIQLKTSMNYVRFLRFYNVLNLIGYAIILYSYQSQSVKATQLTIYLLGFAVSSIATFAYELTHNYLLYRSFFLQVLAKMKRDEANN